MLEKISVVTDAISPDYFFDIWFRYYAGVFEPKNLFLITYPGQREKFGQFPLGGVIELPDGYNNEIRARFISSFVQTLLQTYQAVVRIDVDEIAVPDLRKFESLRSLLQQTDKSYLTARGFDLIQTVSEPEIDLSKPIIGTQRNFAYPNSSLNKTFFTRIPIRWAMGFHAASVYPMFGDCFIFHLKRLDIAKQLEWVKIRERTLDNEPLMQNAKHREYYLPGEQQLLKYHSDVSGRKVVDGWDGLYRAEHEAKFMSTMKFSSSDLCYHPQHFHEHILARIPEEYKGLI